VDLIKDAGELDVIVNTSIQAGKRAMQSSAFSLAAFYFELAISALGDRSWQAECYDITLSLYNGCSETCYCSTDFEAMELKCNAVFHHAKTFQDRLQAYTTLVYANSARHQLDDALNMAFDVLHEVGEPFPADPSLFRVMLEYYKIRRLFHSKTDRFFLSLPESTTIEQATAMRMMSFTSFTAYVVKPNLAFFLVFRLLQMTLEHGITGPAVLSFASYGYVLCTLMGRVSEGARFARLALTFLDQGVGRPWLPCIHFNVHLVLRHSVPFCETLEPLFTANRFALKSGDIEATVFIASELAPILFHIGKPLQLVEEDLRSRIMMMDQLGQKTGSLYQVPIWHVACDLMGREPYPLDLSGDVKDAETACRIAEEENNNIALAQYYWYRAMYRCLLGEFQTSLDMAKKSREMHAYLEFWLTFFEGISSLALARNSSGRARQRLAAVGRKAGKYMKRVARCPNNFAAKEALLEAEITALKGQTARALALFDDSIKFAHKEGFLLEKGLAYDRLAEYHRFLGGSQQALSFFECARETYRQWGANRLVLEMEKKLAYCKG
jgi:predicted ATPase